MLSRKRSPSPSAPVRWRWSRAASRRSSDTPSRRPSCASIARCTGELGALASEPVLDPASPEGVAQLDAARSAAYGATRISFGAAGNAPFTASVVDAVRSGDSWPKGSSPETAWPSDDSTGAYAAAGASCGQRSGHARVFHSSRRNRGGHCERGGNRGRRTLRAASRAPVPFRVHAQWLYGLLRALPGERLFCHRRPQKLASANLTPAPRRQDHTTSPYASRALVLRTVRVHRIPPHVRDDREPPLIG